MHPRDARCREFHHIIFHYLDIPINQLMFQDFNLWVRHTLKRHSVNSSKPDVFARKLYHKNHYTFPHKRQAGTNDNPTLTSLCQA